MAGLAPAGDELVGDSVEDRDVDEELLDRSAVLPVGSAPRAAVPLTWLAQPASSSAVTAATAASRGSQRIPTPECIQRAGVQVPALMRRDLEIIATGNHRGSEVRQFAPWYSLHAGIDNGADEENPADNKQYCGHGVQQWHVDAGPTVLIRPPGSSPGRVNSAGPTPRGDSYEVVPARPRFNPGHGRPPLPGAEIISG